MHYNEFEVIKVQQTKATQKHTITSRQERKSEHKEESVIQNSARPRLDVSLRLPAAGRVLAGSLSSMF